MPGRARRSLSYTSPGSAGARNVCLLAPWNIHMQQFSRRFRLRCPIKSTRPASRAFTGPSLVIRKGSLLTCSSYETLSSYTVKQASTGSPVQLTSLWQVCYQSCALKSWTVHRNLQQRHGVLQTWSRKYQAHEYSTVPDGIMAVHVQADANALCAVIFMTHFADLSSWELAQKLRKRLPKLTSR